MREKIFIASKTMAKNPEDFWIQLDTTLTNLKTDYLDIYQLHCVPQCYEPGDGTGMYECLKSAKQQGIVKHIGVQHITLKQLLNVLIQDYMKQCNFHLVIFVQPERLNL